MIKGALADADKQAEQIASRVNEVAASGCKTGISVAAENVGNSVVVNVKVKSANVDNCRVAVWLLEDGIVAAQTGGSSTEVHNNVLRASVQQLLMVTVFSWMLMVQVRMYVVWM